MNPTVVYLAYDADGTLLYVGIANDWPTRRKQHQRKSPWWPLMQRMEFEQYPSRQVASIRESELIGHLDPPHNGTAWHRRDVRIAALRQEGRTNAEIARELNLSKAMLSRAINRLLAEGRIQQQQPGGGIGGRRVWNIAHPERTKA